MERYRFCFLPKDDSFLSSFLLPFHLWFQIVEGKSSNLIIPASIVFGFGPQTLVGPATICLSFILWQKQLIPVSAFGRVMAYPEWSWLRRPIHDGHTWKGVVKKCNLSIEKVYFFLWPPAGQNSCHLKVIFLHFKFPWNAIFFSRSLHKENGSALPCMHCNPAYDDDELCNASQQQQQQQLTSSVLRKTIRATAGGLLQPIEARNQMMARQERLLMCLLARVPSFESHKQKVFRLFRLLLSSSHSLRDN